MITLNEAEAINTGLSSVEDRNESRVFQALDSLTGIAEEFLSENEEADAVRVIQSISEIAQATARESMELVTINAVIALGKLAKAAAKKGYGSALNRGIVAIGKTGRTAASNSLEAGSKVAATTLMEIWNLSSPKEKAREELVAFSLLLRDIGAAAAVQGMEEALLNAATCLGEVGKKEAAESLELETISTLILLEEIGATAAEKYFDEALSSIALSIEDAGKLSIKKGLHEAALQSQWVLETLRIQAEEKLLANSPIVIEMALDSFKLTGATETEENIQKLQEIKELQTKVYSSF
jgi:hypothetical protein